jgi:hypothetical protein
MGTELQSVPITDWKSEKALEMDGGDVCTTVGMHLMHGTVQLWW